MPACDDGHDLLRQERRASLAELEADLQAAAKKQS